MARKGRFCPKCDAEVRDAKIVEKPGRWMVKGTCGVCGARCVFTKGKSWVERERREHGSEE